jgi:hypothetical protein
VILDGITPSGGRSGLGNDGYLHAVDESALISAAPEEAQQTAGDITPIGVGGEDAGGISTTKRSIPGAAISPALRMTWDSAPPELDAFGNETVPVFNSTYSGR